MTERRTIAARVGVSIVWSQSLGIMRLLITTVYSVVIIRSLPVNDYGTYAFIFGVAALLNIALSLGLDGVIGRFASQIYAQDDTMRFTKFLRTMISVRIASLIMLAALLSVFGVSIARAFGNVDAGFYLQVAWPLLAVQSLVQLFAQLHYASLQVRYAEIIALVERLLSIVFSVLMFWRFGANIGSVLIALFAANTIALLMLVVPLVSSSGAFLTHDWSLLTVEVRKFAANYWLTNLLTYGLGSQSDILIISYILRDPTQIAYYSVGMALLTQISAAAVAQWKNLPLPALTQAREIGGHTAAIQGWKLFTKLFCLTIIPISVFTAIYSRELLTILFGAEYVSSSIIVQFGAIAFIQSVFTGVFATLGGIYVYGQQHMLLRLRVITAGINIGLGIILTLKYGLIGTVSATLLSTGISNWMEFFLLRRSLSIVPPWRFGLSILGASCLAAVTGLLFPSGEIGWLIASGILFVVLFVVILLILKPFTPDEKSRVASINQPAGKVFALFTRLGT